MRTRPVTSVLSRSGALLILGGALALGIVATPRAARAQEVEVEIDKQPPAPRIEVIPARPSPNHFWVHGYYGWNGAAHVWNAGRYEAMRPGWGWSESHWVGVGPRYHFYPGHWYAHR